MRQNLIKRVRELLQGHDGLTIAQIHAATHASSTKAVRASLGRMPDAYIDRWVESTPGHYAMVWCLVTPPPHCPKPRRKKP